MQRSLNADLTHFQVFIIFFFSVIWRMSFLAPQGSFSLWKGDSIIESTLLTGFITGKEVSLLQYLLTEKGLTKLMAPVVMWQFLWSFQSLGQCNPCEVLCIWLSTLPQRYSGQQQCWYFFLRHALQALLNCMVLLSCRRSACSVVLQSGGTAEGIDNILIY